MCPAVKKELAKLYVLMGLEVPQNLRPYSSGIPPSNGFVSRSDFADIDSIPEEYTDNDMQVKVNTILGKLKPVKTSALAAFMLLPFVAVSAPVLSVETARKDRVKNNGDIVTNVSLDVQSLISEAGLATTHYVDEVALNALVALTNDFEKNFLPLAAPIITSVVEDVLAPQTVTWKYDENVATNAVILPNWATSKLSITSDPEISGTEIYGDLYASGKLRNYSLVIDSLPQGRSYTVFIVDPKMATNSNYKIYATPAMRDLADVTGRSDYGWNIVSNDIPCLITLRQPDSSTLIFRRDRLNTTD